MTVEAQAYGEVFTRRWVVDFMLDLCGYTPDQPLHTMTAVEPSIGSGAFLIPMVERLIAAKPAATNWDELSDCIRGFDLQAQHVETCRMAVEGLLIASGCPASTAQALASQWTVHSDFLLQDDIDAAVGIDQLRADFVIGNPPYIRIEDLPAGLLARYRQAAPTMRGRADIFVGFYEHGLDLLKPGGRLAFICADRWMRNSYGKALRGKILREGFSMDDVVVMHDAPAFESEVSAYPAITVIRRGTPQGTRTATTTSLFDGDAATRLLKWSGTRTTRHETPAVRAARLPTWHQTDDVWPDGSPELLSWLADLAARFPLIEDESGSTRIGIGVATGADSVYIPNEPPAIERSQLVPLVMAQDIREGRFEWKGRHLVSPWGEDGPVNLRDFPRLHRYLESHAVALLKRNVAQRTEHWHRTIDRVNPGLLKRDLLVMEDLKFHSNPVRVPAGYYPHHNLTWITSTAWDLDVLGGLLLSELVEKQVAAYCVKMRGGTLRFQPTVMRKVRLPRPEDISPAVAAELARAFTTRDRAVATAASLRAFGYAAVPD